MLALEYEGRVDELAEYLENRVLSYLTPRANPGSGEVAVSVNWFPLLFPWNRWPVQGASELYQEGRSRLGDAPTMPGVVSIGWRCHDVSVFRQRGGATREGRQEARDRCRRVFARWREAFLGDDDLASRSTGLALGRAEAADKDRLGTFYEEVTSAGVRVIWVHQAEALVYL